MTKYRKELESFTASKLPKTLVMWTIYRNRWKFIILIVILASTTVLKADEIQTCLDDPKTVWDMTKWKCRAATKEELPYAKG